MGPQFVMTLRGIVEGNRMLEKVERMIAKVATHPGPEMANLQNQAEAVAQLALGRHAVAPAHWLFAGPDNVRQPLFEAFAWKKDQPKKLGTRLMAALLQGAVDAAIAGVVLGLCIYVRVKNGKGPASDFLLHHRLLLTSAATFLFWPTLWTIQGARKLF